MGKTLRQLGICFWSKVEKTPTCWLWKAAQKNGYGLFYFDNKLRRAHRVSYEDRYGKIPPNLVIDHLCRNPSCIRPDHLEAVTQRENLRRGHGWSGVNYRKTSCKHGHAFTPDNVIKEKRGRKCLTCRRLYDKRRYLKRRQDPRYVTNIREKSMKWYYAHKEISLRRNKIAAKKWRLANPEKHRENSKKYYWRHREQILARKRLKYATL